MTTAIAGYRQLAASLPAAIDNVARQPDVKRETENYLAGISNVKSVDDFMANPKIYRYAMHAFGLEDMLYATAFVRRVLTEGIDRSDSLANKLQDGRFRDLADTFNFARYGNATTAFTRTQQGVVDRYARQRLEENAGSSNEGIRLALYFERSASKVTSAYGLLADRALLKVTQVALGLPEASSTLNIDRQADLISKKLDIADLKDPPKLDKLLTRFTALWDMDNPKAAAMPQVSPLAGNAAGGIGIDLLQQIQSFRRRG